MSELTAVAASAQAPARPEPLRAVGGVAASAAAAVAAPAAAVAAPAAATAARAAPAAATAARAAPAAATAAPCSSAPPPPIPRLEVPHYDLAAALTLEAELGVSHVLAQVLIRRGLGDPATARAFLEPVERHPADAFAGMQAACELIGGHIAAGRRIIVHGDYDVDGVCATAIMVRALRALGADVGWLLPSRLDDGYGLTATTIERLRMMRAELLITVDCGITAVDEVALALQNGIDVLVTDHHAPRADGELPPGPVLHPTVSGYPCADLCGAAVAHKLAQALGARTADDDLELVALATVADLVPLRGENRRLVREGLSALANTCKPGLRALMQVSRVDPSGLDAHTLGFRLAPRINAAGRLRRADAGLELLLTEDEPRAFAIASELDAVNVERRAVEERILWEAEAQVATMGARSAYVLAAEGWHPGVIGIVASRVVERHHRPTILVALDGPAGTGSGRSIPGFDLLGALHVAAGQIERYGGHRAAAGLTIRADRVEALRECLETHAASVLTAELLEPVERVDAVASGAHLGLSLAGELALLEPCGIGNPGCRLLVPGGRFGELRPMGEGRHARFSVSSGGARARAVAFGCEGRLAGDAGRPLDATFRLERHSWNGALEPRLVLRHAQPCSPEPVEVLGEPADYVRSAFDELDADLRLPADQPPGERHLLDRRGESPLAVIADACAADGRVLAVCADVPRRITGLRERVGGFALVGYYALARDPSIADEYRQIVVLDPPSSVLERDLARRGCGFSHVAWGEAELRFVQQMHELEYGLRASLVALYRSLKLAGRVAGEELERLLRGDGPHARPARLAGRLIRVLAELELVSLDRDLPALAIGSGARTALEHSPAYRVYAQRYEDGKRFLTRANPQPSG
jgi:single-stranded-DNA-specific exonuclease